jgi:hypothetical protein
LTANVSYTLQINDQMDLAGNVANPNPTIREFIPGGTNCCDNCFPANFIMTNIAVSSGVSYLVNPLCHGRNNTLADIVTGVPDQTMVSIWNGISFSIYTYDLAGIGGWDPDGSVTINPGEGFVISSPSPFFLTFSGCLPTCPLPCAPASGFSLVGPTGFGAARYTNLFSCPPACGTRLQIWSPHQPGF